MLKLINIKKAPKEIAQILAQNETLRSLLVNDSSNALSLTCSKTVNDLINEHYIWFYPPTESGIKEFDRNSFLTIMLDTVRFDDGDGVGYIYIYIATTTDCIILDKNRNRLLEACDLIIDSLSDVKVTSMGRMQIHNIAAVEFSSTIRAYRITLSLTDLQNERSF